MLEILEKEVLSFDWKKQKVTHDDNEIYIAALIADIEAGIIKTKKIKLDLSTFDLSGHFFKDNDLFDFMFHMKLVNESNLDYPIIMDKKGTILDGRHRICKAILEGYKNIIVVKITE